MFTPFSFWHKSVLDSQVYTLEFTDTFTGFQSLVWNPVVYTLQYTENFTNPYLNPVWAPVVYTLEFTETFNPW